jgi:hypothetical protein
MSAVTWCGRSERLRAVPESVKVLTVYDLYICENSNCGRAMAVTPLLGPFTTCRECGRSQRMKRISVVPQAELDRLRAVGEPLTRQVGKLLDSWYEFDDDRVPLEVFVAAIAERIEDVDAALKSYREAVPE